MLDGTQAQFEVRVFAMGCGVDEDPVTGSLNAGLPQWLIGTGLAPEHYIASQGTCLGRAGRVHVASENETVWIGGATTTLIEGIRILRSETSLEDVPVLYRPGAVFVLQGTKQGFLNGEVYRYDADHYLAVSVPVPFRMASQASSERPLLAIYFDFDLQLAAEIVTTLDGQIGHDERMQARSLVSSRMMPSITDALQRLLHALHHPQELAILGPGLLHELHYRVLIGPQGGSLMAALRRNDSTDRICAKPVADPRTLS